MEAVNEATGSRLPRYAALALAAWQGREPDAAKLIGAGLKEAAARGEGMGLTVAHNAAAVLYNGLGRYQQALAAAQRAGEYPAELGFSTLVLPELIEAAARSGASLTPLRRPSGGSRRRPAPAAPTGRSGSRPARAPC